MSQGNQYTALGWHEKAQNCYSEALKDVQSIDTNKINSLPELNSILEVLMGNAKIENAVALATRIVQLTESAYGREDLRLVHPLCNLANFQERLGGPNENSTAFKIRALNILNTNKNADSKELALAELELAKSFDFSPDRSQRKILYEQAVARKALPADNQIEALEALGMFSESEKSYDDAEKYYAQALALAEKTYGKNSPQLLSPLQSLAHVYTQNKHYDLATGCLNRALALYEGGQIAKPAQMPGILSELAALVEMKHDYATAEKLYRQALAVEGDSNIARTENTLNRLIANQVTQEKYDSAKQLYERLLRMKELEAVEISQPFAVGEVLENYAAFEDKMGRPENAKRMRARILAIQVNLTKQISY